MDPRRFFCRCVPLIVLLGGCGAEHENDGGRLESDTTMGAYREPRGPESAPPAPLRMMLRTPSRVGVGDTVPVTLVVRNTGLDSVKFSTGNAGTTFTVMVSTPEGQEIWERMRYLLMDLIAVPRVLGPGDELRLRTLWPQQHNAGHPVGPGTYHMRGVLFVVNSPSWTTDTARVVVVRRP